MNKAPLLWLGGATVALGCAALLWDTLPPAPTDTAAVRSAPFDLATVSPADAAAELVRVRAELAALRTHVAGLEQAAAPSGDGEEPGAEPALSEAEQRAEAERQHAAYMDGVEEAFRGEPVDPAWSSSAASHVWQSIDRLDGIRGAARAVECRSQSCRVEIRDDGAGSLDKHLPELAVQLAESLPRMSARAVRDERGGRTGMVLYLSRGAVAPLATN